MSQRSPRSPRSKSASCHDGEEEEGEGNKSRGRVFDEIQQEMEEELENAGRVLSGAASRRESEHPSRKSTRTYSRMDFVTPLEYSAHGSPVNEGRSSPGTRRSSARATFPNEDAEARPYSGRQSPEGERQSQRGNRGPSPEHLSPNARGSRAPSACPSEMVGVAPGAGSQYGSQRGTRGPTPEQVSPTVRGSRAPSAYFPQMVEEPMDSSGQRGTRGPSFENVSRPPSQVPSTYPNEMFVGSPGPVSQYGSQVGSKRTSPQRSIPVSANPSQRGSRPPSAYPSQVVPEVSQYGSQRGSPPKTSSDFDRYQSQVSARGPSAFSYREAGQEGSEPRGGESGTSHLRSTRGPSGVSFAKSGSCPVQASHESFGQQSRAPTDINEGFYCPSVQVEEAATSMGGFSQMATSNKGEFGSIPKAAPCMPGTPIDVPPEYGRPRGYQVAFPPPPPSSSRSRPPIPRTPLQRGLTPSPQAKFAGGEEALKHLTKFGPVTGPQLKCPDASRRSLDLTICDPACKKAVDRTLPKKPQLSMDEIKEMIECESRDVDSAWYLTSDQKKMYKKPCPKQQKAQMSVKNIVHSHAEAKTSTPVCGKEYSPLLEPDPEDISIEVAAAMMFSQEEGVKLEECPNETIKRLFPDDTRGALFGDKIPPSTISIVDTNQKDQEELIEKSAEVPEEGVSDSAYTRMKQKGEEMGSRQSYDLDFTVGQEKREYLLVPQRPPRFNKIQFRGNAPPWFPGYFSLFPDDAGGIKVVDSPSQLFHRAWVSSNPGTMPPGDVTVLD